MASAPSSEAEGSTDGRGVDQISGSESDDELVEDTASSETSAPRQKRKKYSCTYRKQYSKRFPWATASKKGPTYAFCMPCGRDVSLGQGGTKDLRKHEQTNVHTTSQQGTSGTKPLHSYFGPVRNESVIEAEVKFGFFLGEHHLAFLLADHCISFFAQCFLTRTLPKISSVVERRLLQC